MRSLSLSGRCSTSAPEYRKAKILDRIVEPERVILFRVPWIDDQGDVQVNRGLPHRDEQRDRSLQGRTALPPEREPGHPQVPGLRAGLQEQPHHPAHGRRQGRLGLRPQGQERQRGDAVLPELHDRALPPRGPQHRRAGRRHRRGRPRDRLPVRPVQAHRQRVHRRAHRQGPGLGRQPHPSRGDRVRSGLLRGQHAGDPRRDAEGQELPRVRLRQRGPVRRGEGARPRRQGAHPVRFRGLHLRRRGHHERKASTSSWISRTCAAAASRNTPTSIPRRSTRRSTPASTTTRCGTTRPMWRSPSATQNEVNGKGRPEPGQQQVLRGLRGAPTCPAPPEAIHVFLESKILYGSGQGPQTPAASRSAAWR